MMATFTESQHQFQDSATHGLQYEHSIISASDRSHLTDRSSKLPSLDKQLLYHSKGRVNKLYRCPITPQGERLQRREKGFVLDGCAVSSRAKYFDMLPTVMEVKEKDEDKDKDKLTNRSSKRGFNFFEAIEYFKLRNRKDEQLVNEAIPETTRARSEVRKPQPLKSKSPYLSDQKVGKSPGHKQRSKANGPTKKRQNANAEASENEDATNNVSEQAGETRETRESVNDGIIMADEIEYVDDFADEPKKEANHEQMKNNVTLEAEEQTVEKEKSVEVDAALPNEQNNREEQIADESTSIVRGSDPQQEEETAGNEKTSDATLPIEANVETDRFQQQEVEVPSEVTESDAVRGNQKNDPEVRVEAEAASSTSTSTSTGPKEKNSGNIDIDSGNALLDEPIQQKKPPREEVKPVKVARKPPTVHIGRQLVPVRAAQGAVTLRKNPASSNANANFNRNKTLLPKRTEMLSISRSKPLQPKESKVAEKLTARPAPTARTGPIAKPKPKPKPAIKTAPSYLRPNRNNQNNRQVRFQWQPGVQTKRVAQNNTYRNRNAVSERKHDTAGTEAKKAPVRSVLQMRVSTLNRFNVKPSKPPAQATVRNKSVTASENKPRVQNQNRIAETKKVNVSNGQVPYRLKLAQSLQEASRPAVPQNSEISEFNFMGNASSQVDPDLVLGDKIAEEDSHRPANERQDDAVADHNDRSSEKLAVRNGGDQSDNIPEKHDVEQFPVTAASANVDPQETQNANASLNDAGQLHANIPADNAPANNV